MTECDVQILGAYHDGELSEADKRRVGQHLATCAVCSAELEQLREISHLFADQVPSDLTKDELDRVHSAVDSAADRPIFRMFGAISTIAASLLIVSWAWMSELPNQTSSPGDTTRTVALSPEAWETVAITLQPTAEERVPSAAEHVADASLADWMLKKIEGESN